MAIDTAKTLRGALAGAVAAGVWAAQQPIDKRLFGVPYDDVELLGKLVTRRPAPARVIGMALHLANGALFGAVYANAAPRIPLPPWSRGPALAMVENFGLWPLVALTDRFHPAREELPRLTGNRAALAQATWRHLLFGVLLGELERGLNDPAADAAAPYEHVVSSNGHGSIEHVVGAS
jgi:hypothetical protein